MTRNTCDIGRATGAFTMRVIGPYPDRSEIELNPAEAYRRGRRLDAMLPSALPKLKRGVYRGTFEFFARLDAARMLEAARKVNRPW
jgi:hypothetical protein